MAVRREPAEVSFRHHSPPLFIAAVAAVVLLAVLPSSLNLPVESPPETLEYAPVPPNDEAPPSLTGNFSSLGLAGSSGLTGGSGPGTQGETGPLSPSGGGVTPRAKSCVGDPPRQTEDPMSPPCVGYFKGDNHGATYQGVTADEIRVILTVPGNVVFPAQDSTAPPPGGYCDVDLPPDSSPACLGVDSSRDHFYVRVARALSRSFNDRYQTYGRRVHLWIYWDSNNPTAESRRAAAADNIAQITPFAVLDENPYGHNDAYAASLARRGVLVLTNVTFSTMARPASTFQRVPGLLWSFYPDIEHWSAGFVSYVCTRVAPYPVTHATGGVGSDGQPLNGRPRVYGLLWADDPRRPGLRTMATRVRQGLANSCGIVPKAEATFSEACAAECPTAEESVDIVTRFRQAGVTTIIWPGGLHTELGRVSSSAGYFPEIVIAGDATIDTVESGQLQDQRWFQNASIYSPVLREDSLASSYGFQACKDGDPSASSLDCSYANDWYADFFMLFKMIQSAGPRLSRSSIDKGMHAIPPTSSTSPYVATCFFDPGDYSCVKDAQEMWWDPSGDSATSTSPGCWRMVAGGRRSRPDAWPSGNEVFVNPSDPCNAYYRFGISPPS